MLVIYSLRDDITVKAGEGTNHTAIARADSEGGAYCARKLMSDLMKN